MWRETNTTMTKPAARKSPHFWNDDVVAKGIHEQLESLGIGALIMAPKTEVLDSLREVLARRGWVAERQGMSLCIHRKRTAPAKLSAARRTPVSGPP
jgi:hypothetical protein